MKEKPTYFKPSIKITHDTGKKIITLVVFIQKKVKDRFVPSAEIYNVIMHKGLDNPGAIKKYFGVK